MVLVSLTTVTWPSAALASATPHFTLRDQSPIATMMHAPTATIRVAFSAADGSHLHLVMYPALTSRSQIAPLLNGQGVTGSPMATTALISPQCPKTNTAVLVALTSRGAVAPTDCGHRSLALGCERAACSGVYPLRYVVTSASGTTSVWSMVAVRATTVVQPLRVALLANIDPTLGLNPSALRAMAGFTSVPLTIGANYVSLSEAKTSPSTGQWRQALRALLASPEHVAITAPPASIDFGWLATHNFSSEVTQQLSLTAAALTRVTGHYPVGPVWLQGSPTPDDVAALAAAGVTNLVVSSSSLAPDPTATLVWGAPVHPTGSPATTVLATDDGLAQLATTTSIPPMLRAILVIDTLAFLHFDAPNALTARTVPLVLSANVAGAAFVHDFIRGMQANPFARLSPLAPSFSPNLIGTNGAPSSWAMATTNAAPWPTSASDTLAHLVQSVHSITKGISATAVTNTLLAAVASAEVKSSAAARQLLLNQAQSLLNQQVNAFRVDNSSVTLTSQGTALPITIVSRAPYAMTVLVHLSATSLTFAKGAVFPITLSSPTTALRIPLRHASSSDGTLQVTVTTLDGRIILAHTALQVRIAGTSFVGYILSATSLVVLGMWWWRTHRRSAKARHGR